MKFSPKLLAATALLAASVALAPAQAKVNTQATLPLELATTAAQKAIEVCKVKGFNVSATVVNKDGVVIAALRGDNAGVHTVTASYRKAFTAASMGRSSGAVVDAIAKNPALEGLRDLHDDIIFLAGGEPIAYNNSVIAGIGVGGAPSGQTDSECALEGIKAIEKSLK